MPAKVSVGHARHGDQELIRQVDALVGGHGGILVLAIIAMYAAFPMSTAPPADPAERFFALLTQHLAAHTLVKAVLGHYRGAEPELQRLTVRPLALRGQAHLQFVYSHRSKDVTRNLPLAEGLVLLRTLPGAQFRHAHLLAADEDVELRFGKKGTPLLHRRAARRDEPAPAAHNREKHRFLDLDRPFLAELGVTDAQHRLVPAMARKWKQINKFVEVFDHAYAASPLRRQAGTLHVADFGAGKGYLTFALHDYLQRTLGRATQVTGVELRDDLVALCNAAAGRLGLEGLHFEQGDVAQRAARPHRRDDRAARLRHRDRPCDRPRRARGRGDPPVLAVLPQADAPAVAVRRRRSRPMLRHGIHLGQEAEMVTDSLRALLLEARVTTPRCSSSFRSNTPARTR